ncbi:MAG: FUSC family protein [Candidatus Dormibacteraeota bacterium]|nr:FUSC family protein [Candidatus Dormibacteraeota bacterium]
MAAAAPAPPAPAAARGRWASLPDPDRAALRRAARVAATETPMVAAAVLFIGNPQVNLMVAFGCFALIVMADFQGPPLPRTAAYVTTTLLGTVLVALGTLCAQSTVAAVSGAFVVVSIVLMAGVFSGYASAAQLALILAFVLAVAVPGTPAIIPYRVLGWTLAGTAATLAALVLWPCPQRPRLDTVVASTCRALAGAIQDPTAAGAPEAVAEEAAAARAAYRASLYRPAGPTRRLRALAGLVSGLEQMAAQLADPALAEARPADAGQALVRATAEALELSATVLTGGPAPDLNQLQDARIAHRRALDGWAATRLQAGDDPADVLRRLVAANRLRRLAYSALGIAADASLFARQGDGLSQVALPPGTPSWQGPAGVTRRIGRTLTTHLSLRSSVLHNALRGALGIAIAVLLTRWLRLDHAFWAVLGTISVLRSNALATGRTALEALAGTIAGFAVGGLFIAVVGSNRALLWLAFPVAAFAAAYAPTGVSFLAGQAAFTVFAIVIFNLLQPSGWQVGLVRVLDLAVGAGVGLAVGLLIWPRGARAELRRAVAREYRGVATFVAAALDRLLGDDAGTAATAARRSAVAGQDLASEALDLLLHQRSGRHLDPDTAVALVTLGTRARLIGDILGSLPDRGYRAPGGSGREVVAEEAGTALEGLAALARRLDGEAAPVRPPAVDRLRLEAAAIRRLREWGGSDDVDEERSAIALVAASEYARVLGELTEEATPWVEAAVRAGSIPWWR